MNLQSSEKPTFTNNDTSIYFNDKQSNNSLSSNIESRINPTANDSLDFDSINELINLHKKRKRKQMMYLCIISGILFLIGFIVLIIGLVPPRYSTLSNDFPTAYIVYLTVGGTLLVSSIILVLARFCNNCCYIKQQFEDADFSVNGQQPVLWGLNGEQWVRYLNYIYGPNRIWTERSSSSSSSFCCRRSTYEQLMNRQYGHIILHENGLIIDELYFVSFRDYTLQDVKILYIDQNSKTIGLRIHTYFQDGKYNHYCYYDLFAPSSVSLEQIQALARAYIIKISGISVLDLPFEVIHLPE
ncbi:unnamed protein product [Adineta steineri]|uniref:Uncharacterized protein n=1 Tax=Adineta steineri TaxID=433720 RepID=A0A819D6W7_9BILA|nr:unnamed protein product [Adineta steineri]CAF3831713.1 unnamed protein product [Adineta steineri]